MDDVDEADLGHRHGSGHGQRTDRSIVGNPSSAIRRQKTVSVSEVGPAYPLGDRSVRGSTRPSPVPAAPCRCTRPGRVSRPTGRARPAGGRPAYGRGVDPISPSGTGR
ncbi:hypothetical protein JCM4814A_84380 [Streptomyces phaeofaciens JCM 4814]|uniref:Uncharacterized protein n=1 Tax=Streptomyces phaeofaciens TaxID=68254 RepID=A0A918LSL2_9ACTN|nr:hypothetical protein GCM10010226_19960 [Streptomyces phaeofaciens]